MAHASDREQIELLKKWWNSYGKGIAIAVVVGIAIGFSWKYWMKDRQAHRVQASITYESLFNAILTKDMKLAKINVSTLQDHYKDTPYASLGAMLLARADVEAKQLAPALDQLNWVISNSKDSNLQQVARLRAAKILIQQKQYTEAQAMVNDVKDRSYKPLVLMTQGDIYSAQAKNAQAKKAYEAARSEFHRLGLQNPFIDLKLSQ